MFGSHIRRRTVVRASLTLLAIIFILAEMAARASSQDQPGTPSEETVANLAAGRVIIAVVKDAILIATVENPIEAETRPPTPVVRFQRARRNTFGRGKLDVSLLEAGTRAIG